MEQLDIQLKSLQHKLQLLLKQNQVLIKENAALQKETETLRDSLAKRTDLMQNLQQQIDILKLSGSVINNSDKKILEKKIDGYLSDIEKCVTLLNE